MKLVYDLTDEQLNIPIQDIRKYATVGEPESDTIIFLDSSFIKTKFDEDENEEPINFIGWSINSSEYIYSRPITKNELLFNMFGNDTHTWDDNNVLNIRPVFESETCKTTNFNLEITDAEDENGYGIVFSHHGHIKAYEIQKVTVNIGIIPFNMLGMPAVEMHNIVNVDIFGGLYQYQNLDFTTKFTNIPKIIADNIDKATVVMLIMWTDKMDESHIDTSYITNDKPQVIVTGEGHIKTDGWVYADDIYVTSDFMERITSSFLPNNDADFLQQIFTRPANHFLSNLIDEIIRKLKTPSIKELYRGNYSTGYLDPYAPGENAVVTFTESVSKQRTGIVLVWSYFERGGKGVQNYDWNYTFIPKWHVNDYTGAGINCPIAIGTTLINKYIYLFDDKLKGHARNYNSTNTKLCLRAVLGV